jgi:SAM-dependent methyltransferase
MTAIESAELRDVYEAQYATGDPARAGAWRELCARNKAAHVLELAAALREPPATVADLGCGDGVVLGLLADAGFGERLEGFEISERAVALAAARPGVDRVRRFDGRSLPVADGAFDLGLLSHVIEHVPDPAPLVAEAARACRALIVEVPLEDNRSASRPAAERGRQAVGHLHRFARSDVAALAAGAGLRIAADVADPLPRAIHVFHAAGPAQRARGHLKATVRSALFALAPKTAERTFTLHYAALCVPKHRAPNI